MKHRIVFIFLLFVSSYFGINSVYGSEEPKYTIGSLCKPGFDAGKPKEVFCFTESKFLKEALYYNKSGQVIPAGAPVSIVSPEIPNQVRITNIKTDEEIIGVAKESIPNNNSGIVQLGNGDPNCSYPCTNNIISNFDTSLFKLNEILYVSEDGGVTNIKPKKVVTIGRVIWSGKAEPDSYTLKLGRVVETEVSTWQYYAREGESCDSLSDEEIRSDLECVLDNDSNYVLISKFPKQNLGDFLYEKTGFAPDATSWLLIFVAFALMGLITKVVWTDSKSKSQNAANAILISIFVGLGIFGAALFAVNVIEPFLKDNPIDYSKKILGIPQYFYLLPTMVAIVMKYNNRK